MKVKLEGAAETDAMCMFVHAVKKKTTEKDPGWRSRATALTLAMNGRSLRGTIEGKGQTICRFELVVDFR